MHTNSGIFENLPGIGEFGVPKSSRVVSELLNSSRKKVIFAEISCALHAPQWTVTCRWSRKIQPACDETLVEGVSTCPR